MCALAALANLGKADIISAQELPNGRIIVNNDPNAALGSGEKQVKIPWMIVSPDGTRGFANDFTTNAISLVSEDGTNFFAHVETKKNNKPDRTKVIQFTVNKDGIPSKRGERYDTEEWDAEDDWGRNINMRFKKLFGVENGVLYFLDPKNTNHPVFYDLLNNKGGEMVADAPPFTASCKNGTNLYLLALRNGKSILYKPMVNPTGNYYYMEEISRSPASGTTYNTLTNTLTVIKGNEEAIESYTGNANGEIVTNLSGVVATLPGAISGLSNNGDEVFATSTATNAFYNVTLGEYNVVKDENGNPKPMVPKTKEGLLRIIDNRKKNGKFLCVTAKGIHAIE